MKYAILLAVFHFVMR